MRSSGENVELRIVSERQPVAGAENVESTLEDAYLYHTQITGGEKCDFIKWSFLNFFKIKYLK